MGPIRVALCDDNHMVRDALATYLAADPSLELVASWADGAELLAEIDPAQVDVVLLDVRMPGIDGPTVARRLQGQPVKIVYLSSYPDEIPVGDAVDGTVVGALTKEVTPEDLGRAIHLAAAGMALISAPIRDRAAELTRPVHQRLDLAEDDRERDVLRLLLKGYTNDEIAARLNRSASSVKQILGKLSHRAGVRTRTELVLYLMDASFQ